MATVALTIATSIVMARLYGIEVVGDFALAFAPTAALWFLSTVREQPGFIRVVARQPARSPRVTGTFVAVFAFSTVLTAIVAALVTAIVYVAYRGPVDQPDLFLPAATSLAGYLIVTNPAWNLDSVLAAFGDGRRLFWTRIHQTIAFLVLLVALSFPLPTVWGPILATIGSWGSSLIQRLAVVPSWMPLRASREDVRAGFRELPEIVKFGLKLTPGSIANGVAGQVGIWTLGVVGTVPQVGAYSRAYTIAQRLGEISWRLHEILFPSLVRRHATGDTAGFLRALVDAIRYVMVGLMLPAAVVGGASNAVMGVFGPGFGIAAAGLTIMMLYPAFGTAASLLGAAVTAINRPVSVTVVAIAAALTQAAATLALTLPFGITGAAVGTVIGTLSLTLGFCIVLQKRIGVWVTQLWPARQVISVGIAYAAGFSAAAALQGVLVQPLGLIVALAGGTIAYVTGYVVAQGPTHRDRQRLLALVRRLRSADSRSQVLVKT